MVGSLSMGVVGCRQELTEMEKRGTGLAFLSVGARWSPCTKRGGGRCGVSMGVVGCRQELTEMEKRGTGLAFLSVGARWSPRMKRGGGRCGGCTYLGWTHVALYTPLLAPSAYSGK